MQATVKKNSEKLKTKEKSKEDLFTPRTKEDDKTKKVANNVATPKNYVQKSSTVDIYGQKKKALQNTRAPKKIGTTHTSGNVTPMKDLLKSSPSSVSQISTRSQLSTRSSYEKKPSVRSQLLSARSYSEKPVPPSKIQARASLDSAKKVSSTPRTSKSLPFSNVTVNSPVAKRKLNMRAEKVTTKKVESKEVAKLERGDSNEVESERHRSKTRTLDEAEVKVLKTENVDNNSEMLNLSRRLSAKPQAFYVDLEGSKEKPQIKSSDEEMSYEDDFESYESDFDSYHSENSKASDKASSENEQSENGKIDVENEHSPNHNERSNEDNLKGKDEELDSGNFDLRDQRSATRSRPSVMEFILEDNEDDKRASLTDEGFQDMSSSSAVSSMRTQVDVLDRPLFIDFTKSKESKRKRKLHERLKQRATDLLGMITLHEMSFSLFEMKPIPYDLYMATFGRSNYTQIAVQTFDDGITEEVQTEEILYDHKWTQHPIEFSKHDVYLYPDLNKEKYSKNETDYLTKFTFLVNNKSDEEFNIKINLDKDYKENPLRLYFEQKDGVGPCKMLPYENYKSKMETCDYDVGKLRKFLKKAESRFSSILNSDDKKLKDLSINSKLSFSKGYVNITPKNETDDELSFLKYTKISSLIFSETKNNLLISIHKKCISKVTEKCVICLWDVSVATREPIKVLIAVNEVAIGRFRGSSDGIFVAALEDGSIHLWDLSEEPTWRNDVANGEKATNLVEVTSHQMTQTEIDREWNLKNSDVVIEELPLKNALQACAYTSSAANMTSGDTIDCVVGLEFVGDARATVQKGGRNVVGQICSLQRIGIISIWSIVQDKAIRLDIGKAYWSKMKLEKAQVINLLDYVDIPSKTEIESENFVDFNLNSAKRRLSNRKIERNALKKEIARPKSTSSSEFDISRPASAASAKKVLPVQKIVHQSWESGIVCCDLKIMRLNKSEKYLIAKNCGEVLCCSRIAGAVKVNTFSIANDTSTVTCLDVSPHGLAYFLAATDSGTVNLYSMVDSRVLLTLDCRNGPPSETIERCQSDSKGRFISSTSRPTTHADDNADCKLLFTLHWSPSTPCCRYTLSPPPSWWRMLQYPTIPTEAQDRPEPSCGTFVRWLCYLSISSLHWSHTNPCCIYTLLKDGTLAAWDLMHSDISAQTMCPHAATACAGSDGLLALLVPDGEIQIHKLSNDNQNTHYLDLFQKYVTLL